VFTVSLGTADGRLIDGTPVPPDPDELRALAEATGAKAYLSRDAESVSEVYSHLGAFIAPSGCAARRRRGLWRRPGAAVARRRGRVDAGPAVA